MTDETKFNKITDEMNELYKKKNHDYGNSVRKTYEEYGMTSFLVRLEDKLNRLKSLNTKKSEVKDESVRDTLIDIANYSILAIIELERKNDKN